MRGFERLVLGYIEASDVEFSISGIKKIYFLLYRSKQTYSIELRLFFSVAGNFSKFRIVGYMKESV